MSLATCLQDKLHLNKVDSTLEAKKVEEVFKVDLTLDLLMKMVVYNVRPKRLKKTLNLSLMEIWEQMEDQE